MYQVSRYTDWWVTRRAASGKSFRFEAHASLTHPTQARTLCAPAAQLPKRAVDGWAKPIIGGEPMYQVSRYTDLVGYATRRLCEVISLRGTCVANPPYACYACSFVQPSSLERTYRPLSTPALEYVKPIRLAHHINGALRIHRHALGLLDAVDQAVESAEEADKAAWAP